MGRVWVWTRDLENENGGVVLNGKRVLITAHALERLRQRLRTDAILDEEGWRAKAEELLLGSKIDPSMDKVQKIKRRINNKFEEAQYFINDQYGIRFVVVEDQDEFKVKTAEKPRLNLPAGTPVFDRKSAFQGIPQGISRAKWERRRAYRKRRNPYCGGAA